MNIFENASRQQLRFGSERGPLTTEVLWNLPLQSKSGFDLDTLAKGINRELKGLDDESFVSTAPNPKKAELELQLEILKFIIADKQAVAAARADEDAKASRRAKLKEVLAKKQDASLESMSEADLLAELQSLK